jgi:tetratricopeptide (TPR) repeat protein
MTAFNSAKRPLRFGRNLALAIALASGTAMVGGLGFADVAHAQKKKKGKKQEAPKAQYSKEFVAAAQALEPRINAGEGLDTLQSDLTALAAMATSSDEQIITGQMLANAGVKSNNDEVTLQGLELMIASGKVPAESMAPILYSTFQLHEKAKRYDQARQYLQQAIDGNFSNDQLTPAYLQYSMAQIDFSEDKTAAGLDQLNKAIAVAKQNGTPVEENWYRLGLQYAYQNNMSGQVAEFTQGWLKDYPTPDNWRLAIDIYRDLNSATGRVAQGRLLDVMRLARKVDAVDTRSRAGTYIDVATDLGFPSEIVDMINQGYETGVFNRDDSSISQTLKTAQNKAAEDRRMIGQFEADAAKPNATFGVVMNAGNTLLSMGQPDKAIPHFEKALTIPGADRNEVLQRLGMAQTAAGNHAAAKEAFAQVDGERAPIAKLWTAYVENAMTGSAVGG